MLPNTNSGNYYFRQQRTADRFQWSEIFSTRALSFAGTHHLKFGGLWTRTTLDGSFSANPIEIRTHAGDLLQRIDFLNAPPFTIRDWEGGGFFQDTWAIRPQLMADIGLRSDYQNITGVHRFAPRAGIAWSPFGDSATTLRAGYGWFFDRVPLNVLAFPYFPARGVPNILGVADYSDNALVFGPQRPGNFAPESTNWSVQIDHRFANVVVVRARYIQSHAQGLMTVRPLPDAYVLGGNGLARSQQFEVMTKVAWKPDRQLFFSYVHSQARRAYQRLLRVPRRLRRATDPPGLLRRALRQHPQPVPGLGRYAVQARHTGRSGRRVADRLSLQRRRCRAELRRAAELPALPELLLTRSSRVERHHIQETCLPRVAKRLQPDQPLEPRGDPLEYCGPSVRPDTRPAPPPFPRGLRFSILK